MKLGFVGFYTLVFTAMVAAIAVVNGDSLLPTVVACLAAAVIGFFSAHFLQAAHDRK